MRDKIAVFAVVLLVLILPGCSKTPKGVLAPDKMAALMADIHTGEAVVDMQRLVYTNDSLKALLKQSIYRKHGVDSAIVDSSYEWYGRNITLYMEVYDKTIRILEQRLHESGNRIMAESGLSAAGDSVDTWEGARFHSIGLNALSDRITFRLSSDPNWQEGDSYTFRIKVADNSNPIEMAIAAEYSNGHTEYLHTRLDGDGWQELTFYTDSTKTAKSIYGFAALHPSGNPVKADSVQLIRRRLNHARYASRYRQRILRAYERGTK